MFAGLPDPGETRLALQTAADREGAAMGVVLPAVERMDPACRGLTAAEFVARLCGPAAGGDVAEVREALEERCGKPDPRLLAGRFRRFARRNFGG